MAGADLRAALVASCFLENGGVSYIDDYKNSNLTLGPCHRWTYEQSAWYEPWCIGVRDGATAEVAGELMTVELNLTYLYPIYVCSFVCYVNNYQYTVFSC